MDGHVEAARQAARGAAARQIAVTPIPKLDPPKAHIGPYATSLERIPRVDETECVGCNLCSLVCPVDECITMVERPTGLGAGDLGGAAGARTNAHRRRSDVVMDTTS